MLKISNTGAMIPRHDRDIGDCLRSGVTHQIAAQPLSVRGEPLFHVTSNWSATFTLPGLWKVSL